MAYTRKDHYYRKAKALNKPSRAAFKLIEMNARLKLLSIGQRAIDLGAWPGGWLLELSKIVGPKGRVVGIDIKEVQISLPKWATFIKASVSDPEITAALEKNLGGQADAIFSDLSPHLTGIAFRDAAAWRELADTAIFIASDLLKPGGNMLIKAFASPEAQDFQSALKSRFEKIKAIVPEASRKESSEFYIAAWGFCGERKFCDS